MFQLLRGLNCLHNSGVVHRDLKPSNILVNANYDTKIADLGLARTQPVSKVPMSGYVTTRFYRAPEVCGRFNKYYGYEVDIWSAGCIFAELLLGYPLFRGKNCISQLVAIMKVVGTPTESTISSIANPVARGSLQRLTRRPPMNFNKIFPQATPDALDLLQKLLSFDPAERPTAAEALRHPYFAVLAHDVNDASAPSQVTIPHDEFAFEFKANITTVELRKLIYDEVLHFNPMMRMFHELEQQQLTTPPNTPAKDFHSIVV